MNQNRNLIPAFLLLLAVFFLSLYQIRSFDFWSHLSYGRELITHARLPLKSDLLMIFSPADGTYPTEEWLFGALLYLLYLLGGIPLILIIKAILVSLAFFFLLRTVLLGNPSGSRLLPLLAMLALFLAAAAARDRFQARPEIFLYLFFSLELFILFSHHPRPRLLGFLPLIHLLWVNLHPSYVLTFYLLALFLLSDLLRTHLSRRFPAMSSFPRVRSKPFLIAGIVCLIVTLINPRAFDALTVTFDYIKIPIFSFFASDASRAQILHDIVAEFRRPGLWDFISFDGLVLYLCLMSFFLPRKHLNLFGVALLAPPVLLFLGSVRFSALASIAAGFVLAQNIVLFLSRPSRISPALNIRQVGLRTDLGVAALVIACTSFVLISGNRSYPFGFGVHWNRYPKAALTHLDRNLSFPLRILNSVGFGGYIQWRDPDTPPLLIDGHWLLDNQDLQDYALCGYIPDAFLRLQNEYRFNVALISYPTIKNRSILNLLTSDPQFDWGNTVSGWPLVYWDDVAMVYLKPSPETADFIRKNSYQHLFPMESFSYYRSRSGDTGFLADWKRELDRAREQHPSSVRVELLAGMYLTLTGNHNEALSLFRRISSRIPRDRRRDLLLGISHARAGLDQTESPERPEHE